MIYYAGLDVSFEETSVCVVDEQGRVTKEVAKRAKGQAEAEAKNTEEAVR